jgi:hypothetical protein
MSTYDHRDDHDDDDDDDMLPSDRPPPRLPSDEPASLPSDRRSATWTDRLPSDTYEPTVLPSDLE